MSGKHSLQKGSSREHERHGHKAKLPPRWLGLTKNQQRAVLLSRLHDDLKIYQEHFDISFRTDCEGLTVVMKEKGK